MFSAARQEDLPSYIKIRKSSRARRLALRLDTKERVFNLVVPKGTSLRKAHAFAEAHDSWMLKRLEKLPAPIPFINGAIIPIFGTGRTINLSLDSALKRTSINLKDKEITVRTYLEAPEERIKRFLKKIARERLGDLAREKAGTISKIIKSLQVRDTKSRWGSCSSDGKISLSWRLMLAPYEALDYVVAHEVAHLTHLNHSRDFWNLCRELSDDFVEGQYWIRNHGDELMRYGAS